MLKKYCILCAGTTRATFWTTFRLPSPGLQSKHRLYDTWPISPNKSLFADILSVLAMTYSDTQPRGTLKYRLLSASLRPAEPDAVDLLKEMKIVQDIMQLVDDNTYGCVSQYMIRWALSCLLQTYLTLTSLFSCMGFLPPS